MQCRCFHSCLDREMQRARWMPATHMELGWWSWDQKDAAGCRGGQTQRCGSVAMRHWPCALYKESCSRGFSWAKIFFQKEWTRCLIIAAHNAVLQVQRSIRGLAQPYRKVPDTFLQQGQVLTTCVHLYPLTNSCLTSVLFKVAVVSSTGLLFKCSPTVVHNSPFPLLFLLCFPVTVTRELFLLFLSHRGFGRQF